MDVLLHRTTDIGVQETEGRFRTQVFTAMDPADIDYTALRSHLDREVDRFTNIGSGWTISVILRFAIHIGDYRPLVGSSAGRFIVYLDAGIDYKETSRDKRRQSEG